MFERWCIIAGPRSGSTWLELIVLSHLQSKKMNTQRLGEFLHPGVAKHEQFVLSSSNQILYGKKQWPSDQETFEGRMLMLLANDPTQSITMRLFPQNYYFESIDYIDVVNKLTTCNFRFISLYRNLFARAVSWAVMDHTSIVHLFKENNSQYHTTHYGRKEKITVESIQICPRNFTRILLLVVRDDISRRMINEAVSVVEIDYDKLEQDIQQLKINVLPTQIFPVHELPYNKLITNYDQLKDIYDKLKTTL
jgi:hypothetical protein